MRTQYGICLCQLFTLGLTKISVILLYRRIFGVDGRRFNITSMALIVTVAVWMVVFFFTNAFQYTPFHSMWGRVTTQAHPTFSSSTSMFLAQSYADVALDAIIISLPIPLGMFHRHIYQLYKADMCYIVYKLHMNTRRKLQVGAVFLMGAM